jgi:hypothetical protein
MNPIRSKFSAIAVVMMAFLHDADAALIVNGDFESPGSLNVITVTSSAQLPGWTVSGVVGTGGHYANVPFLNSVGYVTTGISENYVELVSANPSIMTLAQTVSGLVSGAQYQLTFGYGNPFISSSGSATPFDFQVTATIDTSVPTVFSDFATTAIGVWRTANIPFTATSTSQTLQFTTSVNYNTLGIALDNVAINPVPEPCSALLILLGTSVFCVSRRSRGRRD